MTLAEAWAWWSKHVAPAPAIWLFPEEELDVRVRLEFQGEGFMTISTPAYNDEWRIHVDPKVLFGKYTQTYVADRPYTYLDYDGFRDGEFQREAGWYVRKQDLLSWQREMLPELGFSDDEVDDVNYSYGRLLLERRYPQEYFAVYPQGRDIVDQSVRLTVDPAPDAVNRLWLYFVPTDETPELEEPKVDRVAREGFTVVELGFLSDVEIPPDDELSAPLAGRAAAGRLLTSARQARPSR
jgi:hypothetical protein